MIILPANTESRWQECDTLTGWRAMWQWMLAECDIAVKAGDMVMASDLLMLAAVAHQHQLAMQPERIAA